jgi:hypothetical protein
MIGLQTGLKAVKGNPHQWIPDKGKLIIDPQGAKR